MIKFFLCLGHGELIHLRNEKQDLLLCTAKSKGFESARLSTNLGEFVLENGRAALPWAQGFEKSKKLPLALSSSCSMAMEYPTWHKDSFPGLIFPQGYWNGLKLNSRHNRQHQQLPTPFHEKTPGILKVNGLWSRETAQLIQKGKSQHKQNLCFNTQKYILQYFLLAMHSYRLGCIHSGDSLEEPQEVAPSGHLYLGIKCKMIDLQAPEIVTKPGTEEQARTKCEWEGKFRLDSGRQCKPEPRTNFLWGGGSKKHLSHG